MNRKGFTLVEVLAVLIVLGIIATIAYPIVTSSIERSEEKAYEEQVSAIEREAKRWALDHSEELPAVDSTDKIGVDVATLINGGYITKTKNGKLYNPKDDKKTMDGCVVIQYSSEYNQYLYNYDEKCNIES